MSEDGGDKDTRAAPTIFRSVEQAWLIKAPRGKPRGLFIFDFSLGIRSFTSARLRE